MNEDRRVFERECEKISFIYSLDDGMSFEQGKWQEAMTEDISKWPEHSYRPVYGP